MELGKLTCFLTRSLHRQNSWLFISNRHYSTFRRKAIRSLTVKESENLHKTQGKILKQLGDNKDGNVPNIDISPLSQLRQGIQYTTIAEGDRRFGPIVLLAKSAKDRIRQGRILLEGIRLIEEAIRVNLTFEALYFDKVELLSHLDIAKLQGKLFKVKAKHLQLFSDTVKSQGIMAVCHKPSNADIIPCANSLPITLVCDNIRDPGNMGTILRTAAAVGVDKVLLTKGCADIWEPKVLRSGMGAHFHVRTVTEIPWTHLSSYLPPEASVYMAEQSPNPCMTEHTAKSSSEDEPESLERVMNSLTTEKIQHVHIERNDEGGSRSVDLSYQDTTLLAKFRRFPFINAAYSDVVFSGGHVVLVVGGETEGTSDMAYKLLFDRSGQKVHIPMTAHVESLNASIACSVILFEMKRQLTVSNKS